MKVCLDCNYENKDEAEFCTRCGTELQHTGVACVYCGARIVLRSRFCDKCGRSLAPLNATVAPRLAEAMPLRITEMNEELLAEARSRFASSVDKSLTEAESRFSEISEKLLAEAEANIRQSITSEMERHLADADARLGSLTSSLVEDFRSRSETILKDKLSSPSSLEPVSETFRSKIEAEPGITPTIPRMSCQSCGAALKSDSQFCPKCGMRVGEAQRTDQILQPIQPRLEPGRLEKRTCRICGFPLKEDSKFCSSCGQADRGNQSRTEKRPEEPRHGFRSRLRNQLGI